MNSRTSFIQKIWQGETNVILVAVKCLIWTIKTLKNVFQRKEMTIHKCLLLIWFPLFYNNKLTEP